MPVSELGIVVPSARPVAAVERPLRALAEATRHAGLPPDAVVVVDDRPPREDLEALVRSLSFRLVPGEAAGPGPARNAGLAAVAAPWVLFLDDDVVLDRHAIVRALTWVRRPHAAVAVIGGLRAPAGSPRWIRWAYRDRSMNSASAAAGSGPIGPFGVSGALLLVQADLLRTAGGFPAAPGWEDALAGAALAEAAGSEAGFERDVAISAVHLNVPADWPGWLERQRAAGAALAGAVAVVPEAGVRLLAALNLGYGWRATVKRLLARIPAGTWLVATGRWPRRLAASAAFTRGFLDRP